MQDLFQTLNLLHKNECNDYECRVNYYAIKDKALQLNFPNSKRNYETKFDEELKKLFGNT